MGSGSAGLLQWEEGAWTGSRPVRAGAGVLETWYQPEGDSALLLSGVALGAKVPVIKAELDWTLTIWPPSPSSLW